MSFTSMKQGRDSPATFARMSGTDEQEAPHMAIRSVSLRTVAPACTREELQPILPSNSSSNPSFAEDNSFNNTCSDEDSKLLFPCWTPLLTLSVFAAVLGGAVPIGFNLLIFSTFHVNLKKFLSSTLQKEQLIHSHWSTRDVFNLVSWTLYLFIPLGCVVGAFLGNRLGRKCGFYFNSVILFLGGSCLFLSVQLNKWQLLIIGRAVTGVFVGSSSVVTNIYLSEVSPRYARGTIGVLFYLGVQIGFIISTFLGIQTILPLIDDNTNTWHYIFSLPLITATVHSVLLLFCPESPSYLMMGGGCSSGSSSGGSGNSSSKGARRALKSLRGMRVAVTSLNAELYLLERESQNEKVSPKLTFAQFITLRHLRTPLLLALLLGVGCQTSGVTSSTVFHSGDLYQELVNETEQTEYLRDPEQLFGLVLLSCQTFGSLLCMACIEKLGRKPTLIISFLLMASCLTAIGFLRSGMPQTSGETSCPKTVDISPIPNVYYITLALLFILCMSFGMGAGPLPWLLVPEMFTFTARGRAVCMANMLNYLTLFGFLCASEYITHDLCGYIFWAFGVICAIWVVYVAFALRKMDKLSSLDISRMFTLGSKRSSNRSTLSHSTNFYTQTASMNRNDPLMMFR